MLMNWMTLVVGVVVLEALVCSGYSITYQDCSKPNRIQEFNIKKICTPEVKSKIGTKHSYKILVPQRNIKTTGAK